MVKIHKDEIRLYMDGNAWCAVRAEGFTDIQECPAGFGSTPTEAVTDLLRAETISKQNAVPKK